MLADIKKNNLYFDSAVWNMLSAHLRCVHLPSTGTNRCLSQLPVTRLQTGLPICIPACRCVCALCDRWKQRPASGGLCAAAWLPGETRHGAVLQMSSSTAQRARPKSHDTTPRTFHLTGPDHWTTPTAFCHAPFRFDVDSAL